MTDAKADDLIKAIKGLSLNVQRGAEMQLVGQLLASNPGLTDAAAVQRVVAINQAMFQAGL